MLHDKCATQLLYHLVETLLWQHIYEKVIKTLGYHNRVKNWAEMILRKKRENHIKELQDIITSTRIPIKKAVNLYRNQYRILDCTGKGCYWLDNNSIRYWMHPVIDVRKENGRYKCSKERLEKADHEVHQALAFSSKLFCYAPARIQENAHTRQHVLKYFGTIY